MSKTHKFPIFSAANKVEWQEQELSSLPPDKIRLEAVMSGISAGTEGMWFDGSAAALKSGRKSYPYLPGYEFIGKVAQIGSAIKNNPEDFQKFSKLKVGDRVFAFKPHGSTADIYENELWVALEDHVSNENALAHALCCTCLHAIHRARPNFGDSSAIFGLGTLGMIMIQLLSSMQSTSIAAVTTSKDKKKMAVEFGATSTFSLDELKNSALPKSFEPVDCVFECSGSTSVLECTTLIAANQAQIIATGFYNDPVVLNGEHLFAKELTVKGVRAAGAASNRNEYLRWPRTENLKMSKKLIENGTVKIESLITHKIKSTDLQKAYEMIRDRSEPYMQIAVQW